MKPFHRAEILSLFLLTLVFVLVTGFEPAQPEGAFWSQWARNSQHTGMVNVPAQPLNQKLADILYDSFVDQEKAEFAPLYGQPVLVVHYQSTLIDGESFYMVKKDGASYPSCNPPGSWWYAGAPCGPNAWNQLQWNEVRYDWKGNQPVPAWSFWTDWKPEPNASNIPISGGLLGWEPVFHPVLAGQYLYVPGAAGTIWKVDKGTGKSIAHIDPFRNVSGVDSTNTFVSSPLTADEDGNVYYNVIQLNINGNPWGQNDVVSAWLVKVSPDDSAASVTYATLLPNAPPGSSTNCPGTFFGLFDGGASLPWPPSANAVPPTQLCGSQRPSVNLTPAVAPDGTIYTVSVAHFDSMVAYLVAVNPDLTPKWVASLQNRLTDGCGVLLPIAPPGVTNMPNSCRNGTTVGVDPTTNAPGSVSPVDVASSSPTVAPDGSILFAALTDYNVLGHLLHFDAQGNYLNAYSWGWDTTPGVYVHDQTYSVVIKENRGGTLPAYCYFNNPVCTPLPSGGLLISQLDANLNLEWSFKNTTIDAAHPFGYEWCVNAPVIDQNGIVYVTSEDGNVYSLPQGHSGVFTTPKQKIFLKEALGAAYTPLSIGEDGKLYTQNDGHLFVVGR